MIRVLFVCLGNICRSPMAEAVFSHLVQEEGLAHLIECESAGTGHWHLGEPPHEGTRKILQANEIDFSHRARLMTVRDLKDFDYIIAMDNENIEDIEELGKGTAAISLLMSYAPDSEAIEVPDPYYTGTFDVVYDLVMAGCEGLLDTLCKEHNL